MPPKRVMPAGPKASIVTTQVRRGGKSRRTRRGGKSRRGRRGGKGRKSRRM